MTSATDEPMSRRTPPPDWYNDLDATFAAAWEMLRLGVEDRRSGFHHPVIATIGLDGEPRQRVMVLRDVNAATATLRVHTDLRSMKIAEIGRDNRVSLLAYDPVEKIQIRIEGHGTLHRDDAIAEGAWATSRRMSKVCYGTLPAPGASLASGSDFTLPDAMDDAMLSAGRSNFAALLIRARRFEWVYLAHEGHRRAIFARDDQDGWAGSWLVP